MKRIVPLLFVLVALAAFWFRSAWLPEGNQHKTYLGSVEAKTILVGVLSSGRLAEVKAIKGQKIAKGEELFRQETDVAETLVAQAEAGLKTAEASLADLEAGKRPEELAVFDRQEEEARASLVLAQTDYRRAVQLNSRGIAAEAQFDAAKAAEESAAARLEQIQANRQVAVLPAREAAIAVAKSHINEARAALDNAKAQMADRSVISPAAAVVDDVFFDAGEVVAQGQPIVSLLTRDSIVLRFFVPEADLAKASVGTRISFSCDQCQAGQEATITRVFNQPEFTPPVIYSETTRSKLVFQIEAKPTGDNAKLQPGQPISVEPLP
jgi:HlyD family secretion protein